MLQVDPEIAKLVWTDPLGTIDSETLQTIRSAELVAPVALSDAVERRDYAVPGDPDVVIRIHVPSGSKATWRACIRSTEAASY
jgi:hypothetical protein